MDPKMGRANVMTKISQLGGNQVGSQFFDVLGAFRKFLASEERSKLPKDQLKVLRRRFASVLEECTQQFDNDTARVLPELTQALNLVSNKLESSAEQGTMLDHNTFKEMEELVSKVFEVVDAQPCEMIQGETQGRNIYQEELLQAQANDRNKMEEIVENTTYLRESSEAFNQRVQELMKELSKITGDKSEAGLRQENDKQALANIAKLTGNSLPLSTLLDRGLVTMSNTVIDYGKNYDVFLGEYFTGEKIAIKLLRPQRWCRNIQAMHEHFARETLSWVSMGHGSILIFYGVGVLPSPFSGEFQLYMISPYLQNQDVGRYLTRHEHVSQHSRLQIICDIARGLEYMHKGCKLGQLIHGMINPSKILIKDNGRAVISNFSQAQVLDGFQEDFTDDTPSYRYMGPEVIDESFVTKGSDIWAWAMTSLEILTGEPPYGRKTRGPQVIRAVGTGRKPKRRDHPEIEAYECANALWDLFDHCWELDNEDRPLATEVLGVLKPLLPEISWESDPMEQIDLPTRPHPESIWQSLITKLKTVLNTAQELENLCKASGGSATNASAASAFSHEGSYSTSFRFEHIIHDVEVNSNRCNPMLANPDSGAPESAVTQNSKIRDWAITSLEIITDTHPGHTHNVLKATELLNSDGVPRRSEHSQIEEYYCADKIWDLFGECWQRIPELRPPAEEVVARLRRIIMLSEAEGPPRMEKISDLISSEMSTDQVIGILGRHGCRNVTSGLDLQRCSVAPVIWGGYGDVYKGWLCRGDKIGKVAIKRQRLTFQPTKEGETMVKSIAHEMYVWSKCRHPNVLEPLGVAKFCGEMCLVSPWMENGKLLSYITSNPGVDRCLACAQIARGLAFIHAHDIVHGDLKADNVLVSQDGEVKLTDFGNTILKTYTLKFSGKVNASGPSLRWAAPELLSEGGMFTIPADVYALGMTILEVITGNVPHHTVKNIGIPMKVVDKREIPERPVNYMPSRSSQANVLWGLLVQCWAYEAEDRLAANMVEKTLKGITDDGLMLCP